MIVTTYKLSNNDQLDFSILPDDAGYFYMTELQEVENKKYEMKLDQQLIDFKSGDKMLNYFFEKSKQMTSEPSFWDCEICGGDNNSGCLYFDPTECPKFS